MTYSYDHECFGLIKVLLTRGWQMAKMLYDNLSNERYKKFVEEFGEDS